MRRSDIDRVCGDRAVPEFMHVVDVASVGRTGTTYGEQKAVVWLWWTCPKCARAYRVVVRCVRRWRRRVESRKAGTVPYVTLEGVALVEDGGGAFEVCPCGYQVPHGLEEFLEAETPDVEVRIRMPAKKMAEFVCAGLSKAG